MKAFLQSKPMYCSREYNFTSRFNQQYEKSTSTCKILCEDPFRDVTLGNFLGCFVNLSQNIPYKTYLWSTSLEVLLWHPQTALNTKVLAFSFIYSPIFKDRILGSKVHWHTGVPSDYTFTSGYDLIVLYYFLVILIQILILWHNV